MTRVAVVFVVAAAACGGAGGSKGPTFQGQHPRIYLGATKDRLVAGLSHPAGQRFQKMVDSWVGGAGRLGVPSVERGAARAAHRRSEVLPAAIAAIEKQVMAAERRSPAVRARRRRRQLPRGRRR